MRGSDGRARPSRLLTSSSDNRSGDFWPAEAKPFASEWLLPSTTNRSPGPSPGQARSSSRRLLPRTRQDAVDAFPRLRHRLFLARGQASQRGPRQDGKVGARGVDADAPLRPLTPRDDVVAAIAASLRGCHLRGSWFGPPVSSHNAPTAGWFQRCLDGAARMTGFGRDVLRLRSPPRDLDFSALPVGESTRVASSAHGEG